MFCGCTIGLDHEGHYINTQNCRVEKLEKELADLKQQKLFEVAFAEKLKEFGTVDRLIEAYSKAKMRTRKMTDWFKKHGRHSYFCAIELDRYYADMLDTDVTEGVACDCGFDELMNGR